MFTFEIITIAVGVAGIAVCGSPYLRPTRVLDELGRQGQSWFDHADTQDVSERPSEETDPPIPVRPLRGR